MIVTADRRPALGRLIAVLLTLAGTYGSASTAHADGVGGPTTPLDAEGCVRWALSHSPKVAEAQARVRQWEARLAEVESTYWPKLNALGFVAPTFAVKGTGAEPRVSYDFAPKAWGPYARLQATLAWPIYSFGRVEAGETAAKQRALVESARVREARNILALEIRRLYAIHLYARSLVPTLEFARTTVGDALNRAQELYAEGTGKVTQVDLDRLSYGQLEVARLHRLAQDGADLARQALKQALDMPDEMTLTLAQARLPNSDDIATLPPREALLQWAAQQRPEWQQIDHGLRATEALAKAELRANAPVLAVGGQLELGWTPNRDDDPNPYHYDPYNIIAGGIAVGFLWNFDPMAAMARSAAAKAMGQEVQAQARFAASGIPLQVRKSLADFNRQIELAQGTTAQVKAAQRWLTFAAAAYTTGTGEARDVMDGLVAFVQAKRTHYEGLRDVLVARAEVLFAVGCDIDPGGNWSLPTPAVP